MSCWTCGAGGELHYSTAAGAVVCEACHCDAAPPASPEALAYKPPKPPRPPRRKPEDEDYEWLFDRIYAGLERASREATAGSDSIFGLGDPDLPLMGWCPACHMGTVAIYLIDHPPSARLLKGCSAGCPPERVSKELHA